MNSLTEKDIVLRWEHTPGSSCWVAITTGNWAVEVFDNDNRFYCTIWAHFGGAIYHDGPFNWRKEAENSATKAYNQLLKNENK